MGTRGFAGTGGVVLGPLNEPHGIAALSQVPVLSIHESPLPRLWDDEGHASVFEWKCASWLGLQSHLEYRCAVDGLAGLGTAGPGAWLASVAGGENGVALGPLGRPGLLGR